jgi:predicted  nucleic acid-binding Zn-ribbon protein
MEQITKEQIEILVRLQETELEIRRIRAALEDQPAKIEALDAELKIANQKISEENLVIEDLKRRYRELEMESRAILEMKEKSQIKLRSVKTNKEYQSTLKEIDDIKAKNSLFEDEMLACLERIETVEEKITADRKSFDRISEAAEEEKASLEKESGAMRQRLTQIEETARTVAAQILPELLGKYRAVTAVHKGGRGVVAVTGAVCQGCNMNIPPQMFNELHRCDSLKFCPFCERIIYWKKEADT